MARPKKPEEKRGATLQIDVDSFMRTRDSAVAQLASKEFESSNKLISLQFFSTFRAHFLRVFKTNIVDAIFNPIHDLYTSLSRRRSRRVCTETSRSVTSRDAQIHENLPTHVVTGLHTLQDDIVTGLQTLQDAIKTLFTAYIKHINAVLGEHGASLDVDAALAKLGEIPLLNIGDNLGSATSQGKTPAEVVPEKKERKKRNHDPNAPKRPLTPFFLYMQTARPIIAKDLGADVPKGAVGVEGTRRWQTMNEEDKQLWTDAYKENLRLYHARIHSYKSGNLNAKDMDEAEAARYAAENNITVLVLDPPVDAPLAGESSTAAFIDEDVETEQVPEIGPEPEPEPEPESEQEPVPVPKTPRSKPNRKQKVKSIPSEASLDSEAIIPSSSIIPQTASAEKEKSPEKKRKRQKKKEDISVKDDSSVEAPRLVSKSRKKKSKSEQN
ncbi:putative high mobility group protein [Golovinomyces cichoracearum]|uniref:Putative high mobility group protein n=1 Tax=Golovinomyces cichoracearum TaxID=62708 RepID=A0A420HCH3_9PEZI|nr:putative high mobility group protein [Golovinomyces cichoracearum]